MPDVQGTRTQSSDYLIEVRNLQKYFPIGGFGSGRKRVVRAVDDVSFGIRPGETLGIVGESGCGKSTTGNMIARLLEPTAGSILFEGQDLAGLKKKEMQRFRADIQMIFQDPFSSLNPRMKVFNIIAEPFVTHKIAQGAELVDRVHELMDVVGLNRSYKNRLPHEFSGGQRQRIGIARALALKPKLIICDEPVSALDVSIQAQILNLLVQLQKEFHLTYIFIAHGIPSVKYISDRVAVMYLGQIVELAAKEELFRNPCHPYTEGLMAAVPIPDPSLRTKERRSLLGGDIPSAINPPDGCRFHTRCTYATERCGTEVPPMRELHPGHFVSCFHPLENGAGILG